MYIKNTFDPLNGTGNFGIDKLKVFTSGFHIDNIVNWNITPNSKKAGEQQAEETPLFISNGNIVNGKKAFVNRPDYTAEVHHGSLYLTLNPSAMFHPYHLTADPNQIADVLSLIQSDLKENLQTEVDLFNTSISRIDLTAQAAMSKTVPHYDNILKTAKHSKRVNKTEYPHGFLFGTGSKQVGTYDKGLKLNMDAGYSRTLLEPTNLLRVEARFLGAESIKRHTPYKHLTHLLETSKQQHQETYLKTFNTYVKIYQNQIDFEEIQALSDLIKTAYIQTAKGTMKRGEWFPLIISVLAGNGRMPTVLEFDFALTTLVHSGILSRSRKQDNLQKYETIFQQRQFLQQQYTRDKETNLIDLHKEFTDNFINQYKTA